MINYLSGQQIRMGKNVLTEWPGKAEYAEAHFPLRLRAWNQPAEGVPGKPGLHTIFQNGG